MGDKEIKIEQVDDDADKQPPRKISKNRGGQERDFNFQKTLKSVDELNDFRFKNYCNIEHSDVLPTFKSLIMRCRTKKTKSGSGKQCDYELLAVREKSEDDTIHVYAHSKHNHPTMPEKKRANIKRAHAQQLMPADENLPMIFRTSDNREWTFVQTFPDYEQLQKYRRKSQCTIYPGRKSHKRVTLPCKHRRAYDCEFQLLSVKSTNTKQGYHVYTVGAHNHHVVKPKKKQQRATRGRPQKHQEMEVDEEEDEEGQAEAEPIEEGGGGGGEEDNDIIVIDDGNNMIKVKPKQEIKRETSMEEASMELIGTPLANEATPKEETLKEMLQKASQKANAKVFYKWTAGFHQPHQIEPKVMEMDTASLLQMVELADQEIKQHPAKFEKWRPWLKYAMPKCLSEVEDFDINSKYKELTGLMLRHVKD